MKRLLWLFPLLLLSALPAHAQLPNAQGWCEAGAQNVVTSGLTSLTQVQGSFPQCTVSVSIHGGGIATIYSTDVSAPLSNPFTATTAGRWQFFAATGSYDVTMTCTSPCVPPTPSPFPVTYNEVNVGVGSGGGGGGPTLQTNSVTNTSQILLNLKNGTFITLTSDGSGGVTVNGAVGGSATNTQVAYGSGTNTFTSSPNFTFASNLLNVIGQFQVAGTSGSDLINLFDTDGGAAGPWKLGFSAYNSTPTQLDYAAIQAQVISNTAGAESGQLDFYVKGLGVSLNSFRLPSTGGYCLPGSTSGIACFGVSAAAGTPNRINYPTSTGLIRQPVITDGGNPQQWSYGTITGNQSEFATWNGATTAARCVDTDANGNLQVTTSDCAASSVTAASQYSDPYYTNSGTANVLGGLAAPTGPNGVGFYKCSVPAGGVAVAPAWCWPGVGGRTNAAGTDAIVASDRTGCVLETNGGAVAISLPQAGTTNFNNNFSFCVKDATTTVSTITPAAGQIAGNNSTLAATLVIPPSSTAYCYSWDNANYQCTVVGTGYVLNILQTGAKCDGATDDTTIINAAYATLAGTYGAKVVWPTNKRCVLSNTITVQNVRGATIEGGGILWKGGAGNPVFLYSTDESVLTESFWITSASGAFPIGTAFQIQEDTGAGFGVSEFNQFFNNSIDCTALGGTCTYGFAIVDGAVVNGNNDGMQFYGNTVYGYGTACFYIANTQYGTVTFTGNNCAGFNVGAEAVLDSPGAPFTWTGGSVSGNTVADFYLSGFAGSVLIQGVHSEQSNRFLEVTFTGAAQPVTLINDHYFSSAHTNAAHTCIEYQAAGPLNVVGGMYGLGSGPICTIYWNGGGGQSTIFGSIVGVDSSSNSSNATNLLKFAPSTLINNVFVAGNNYLDVSGNAAPPTTPDLAAVNTLQAQTANTTDAHFGSLQSNSTSACETTYAVTTLSTIATTTDTGLNCLPINAIIDAVVYRVTVTITTAATFQIGDATISGRFSGALSATPCGASGGLTAGSTGVCFVQADQTGTSGPRQTAAAKVRVSTNVNPGAGAIRLIVYYHTWTAPAA